MLPRRHQPASAAYEYSGEQLRPLIREKGYANESREIYVRQAFYLYVLPRSGTLGSGCQAHYLRIQARVTLHPLLSRPWLLTVRRRLTLPGAV